MEIPRKYLHDRAVLFLVSSSVFLLFLCTALILLRASIGQGLESYFVSYRANLGLGGYEKAGILPILSFVAFSAIIFVVGVLLSIKTYSLRKSLSTTILSLTVLLQIFAVVVSNALLALN